MALQIAMIYVALIKRDYDLMDQYFVFALEICSD